MKKGILNFLVFLIRCSPCLLRGKISRLTYKIIEWMYPARSCGVFFKRSDVDGNISMLLDVTEKAQRRIFLDNIYEPRVTKYISDNLGPGDVFIDVGANVGYFSLIAAKRVGSTGKVIAFEPAPSNFSKLVCNLKLNHFDNVICYPFAVYDKESSMPLFLNPLNEGGNSLIKFEGYNDEIQVQAIVIDNFLEGRHPSLNAKLIKIDVEGAELNVIKSMQNLLRRENAPEIICEVSENLNNEITSSLFRYGYKKYRLADKDPILIDEKDRINKIDDILFSKNARRQ